MPIDIDMYDEYNSLCRTFDLFINLLKIYKDNPDIFNTFSSYCSNGNLILSSLRAREYFNTSASNVSKYLKYINLFNLKISDLTIINSINRNNDHIYLTLRLHLQRCERPVLILLNPNKVQKATIKKYKSNKPQEKLFGELPKYTEIATLRDRAECVSCLTIHDNKLYGGSNDYNIGVWNTDTFEEIATLREHTCIVSCLAIHDNRLYSGSWDDTVRVWSTDTFKEIAILRGHTTLNVECLAIHDNRLYSGSGDGTICVWNTDTYEKIATLKWNAWTNALALHENRLYSAGRWNGEWGKGDILVWSTDTFEEVATLKGHTNSVGCLAVHENKLFSGSCDFILRVWKI